MRSREMRMLLRSMLNKVRTTYTRCHQALAWLLEECEDFGVFAGGGGINLRIQRRDVLRYKRVDGLHVLCFRSGDRQLVRLAGQDLDRLGAEARACLLDQERAAIEDVYANWKDIYARELDRLLNRRLRRLAARR